MKRYWTLLVIILFLFALYGCGQTKSDFMEPVTFYFCRDIADTDMSNDDFHNVFVAETREGAGYTNNLIALLSLYLNGPITEELTSPFHLDVSVISYQTAGDSISIVLSDSFSAITGLDLTIACTCLSMTVMEFTGCNSVEISLQTALLDEQNSIVISREQLVFEDNTQMVLEE